MLPGIVGGEFQINQNVTLILIQGLKAGTGVDLVVVAVLQMARLSFRTEYTRVL